MPAATTLITKAERMHSVGHQLYRQGLIVSAQATLLEILHTARDLDPDAKWVHLDESDQSFDGDQWVVGCTTADGTIVSEDGEEFQEIGMDINEKNASVWHPFRDPGRLPERRGPHTCFLDLDAILAAVRRRGTTFDSPPIYDLLDRLAECKLTDEIEIEDQPEDDTSTLDHFITKARNAIGPEA